MSDGTTKLQKIPIVLDFLGSFCESASICVFIERLLSNCEADRVISDDYRGGSAALNNF